MSDLSKRVADLLGVKIETPYSDPEHFNEHVAFCYGAEAERQRTAALDKLWPEVINAISGLRNEVKGTLSAHQYAIRNDYGNTNWECLMLALKKTDDVLEKLQKAVEGD